MVCTPMCAATLATGRCERCGTELRLPSRRGRRPQPCECCGEAQASVWPNRTLLLYSLSDTKRLLKPDNNERHPTRDQGAMPRFQLCSCSTGVHVNVLHPS
jgi:hypothetical protein